MVVNEKIEEGQAVPGLMGDAPDAFPGTTRADMSIGQLLFSQPHYNSRAALEKRLLGIDSNGQSIRVNSSKGLVHHPFSFSTAIRLHDLSPHHSACVNTIVAMVAGLGMRDEEVQRLLDSITPLGWDDVMTRLVQDVTDLGTGYIEVVRDPDTRVITGLHYLPSRNTFKVLDGDRMGDYHFAYLPHECRLGRSGEAFVYDFPAESQPAFFSRFGDADNLAARIGEDRFLSGSMIGIRRRSGFTRPVPHVDFGEVIEFQLPTNRWDHYGAPDWIGVQPYLDLSCKHLQRTCDYMHNRGTPDHLLLLFGVSLNDKQRTALETCMGAGRGRNYGRSATIAFPASSPQTSSAQLEKFSDGVDGAGFRDLHDTTALAICTAHRMPPVLAGVSVPRPIGSSNEMVQAIVLTHFTVSRPIQRMIQTRLACTLGLRGMGIPSLNVENLKISNILEDTDITALDTLARQNDTTMTRDNSQGLRR